MSEHAGRAWDVETAPLLGAARAAASIDEGAVEADLPREVMAEIFGHAREAYPCECCGLLVGPPRGTPTRVVRCTNVQSRRRAEGQSDLDERHAFWIDEGELEDAVRQAEGAGETLLAVYHSHVDAPAYLSQMDLQGALGPDGRPAWPGAAQIVVSISEDGIGEAAVFEWDETARLYRGRRVRKG
jgi:proteasome lid subunit RPN8/RPN11